MASATYLPVSLLLPLFAIAQQSGSSENGPSGNASSEDGGGPQAPTNATYTAGGSGPNNAAGGSGSDNSYKLSTGGEVAIIVVVVIVALLGIASTILYFVAKKRQWEVRKSIRRASRRVASKVDLRPMSRRKSQSRAGMTRMQSPSARGGRPRDPEKGEGKRAVDTIQSGRPAEKQRMAEKAPPSKATEKQQDKKITQMEVDDSNQTKFNTATRWKIGGRR